MMFLYQSVRKVIGARCDNSCRRAMHIRSPQGRDLRRSHPLAHALASRLTPPACILELGTGNGRNTRALEAAGFTVLAVPDRDVPAFAGAPEQCDAALSTHGFLHGTSASLSALLASTAGALRDGAPLYCTFASTSDARYGRGARIDERTYAPETGDEIGVAHVYFDENSLRMMLEPFFAIDELGARCVDEVVGRWAHARQPTSIVHWFLRGRKR